MKKGLVTFICISSLFFLTACLQTVVITDNTAVDKPNIIHLETLKVGDKVAGMIVESIESVWSVWKDPEVPYDSLPINQDNVLIKFKGETTVTGDYHYWSSDPNNGGQLDGELCMDFDDTSLEKLPAIQFNEGQWGHSSIFCFNDGFAKEELGHPGSKGTATVVIDDYTYMQCDCAGIDRANLLKVIEKK